MFYIRVRLWYQDELLENERKWGVKKNVVTRRGVRVMITRSSRTQSKWEMILSLEVGEHLPKECAETFVYSLTQLAPVILFSAAIPFQGGTQHVNEQWQDYWVKHFQNKGYVAIDCIRNRVWGNERVEVWYAQNILIFAKSI